MFKVAGGVILGILLSVGTIVGVAHADLGDDLFTMWSTRSWDDVDPVKYEVQTKGRDVRVYEFQSKLNPKIGIAMIFAKSGSMATSFPIDLEAAAVE